MAIDLNPGDAHRVARIDHCHLSVGDQRWQYAEHHADAIDAHWIRRQADNPAMFNGQLFVLGSATVGEATLTGSLIRTDFKSLLYWKEHGYLDRSVRDVFGSALIISAEGHIVLGRQAAGNLNAGLAYLPGGFIDSRDVAADGSVDLEASVARELAEETGLDRTALARDPGFVVTYAGPLTSIAVPFRSVLPSRDLVARIHAHIAADPAPELSEAVVVRSAAELVGLAMPVYAQVLLADLLATT